MHRGLSGGTSGPALGVTMHPGQGLAASDSSIYYSWGEAKKREASPRHASPGASQPERWAVWEECARGQH